MRAILISDDCSSKSRDSKSDIHVDNWDNKIPIDVFRIVGGNSD